MKLSRVEVILTNVGFSMGRTDSSGRLGEKGMPANTTLVRLFTDDGISGAGYTWHNPHQPESHQTTIGVINDYYGPAMIGMDPFDIEKILDKLHHMWPGNYYAKSIIDASLHDIMGKALGVPAYKLLGGLFRESIPMEWSLGMNPVDEMVREVNGIIEKYAIKYLCIKVGGPWGWKQDVKNVRAVRKAIGDDIAIGIDANEAYSPVTAIKVLKSLEECDLYYAEQPIQRWNFEGIRKLKQATTVPIMPDEGVFTLNDAVRNIEAGVDFLCLKLPKHAGIHCAKKIAAVAEAYHIPVNLGSERESGIGAAAAAHFYASTKNIIPAGEFIIGILGYEHDLLTEETRFVIKDGCTTVPNRPGLGVDLDEKAVKKYTVKKWVVGK